MIVEPVYLNLWVWGRAYVGHPCQLKLNPSPPAPLPRRGEGSKRIRFPFSHATKAKHPLSSLLAGGNEGGWEKGLGDEGENVKK